MNVLVLADQGERALLSADLSFQDKVEKAMAVLRSKGVLPIKRAKQNGALHTRFAATIVSAFEQVTSIDVHTRRHGDLHQDGHSTLLIKWLDEAVKQSILIPANGVEKAEGSLTISPLLKEILKK